MRKDRKPKMRETDRLIRNIAICTLCPGESLKDAEKAVRSKLHLSKLQNGKPEVVILREMWQQLKTGTAHMRMNQMIKNEYITAHSFDDFDRKKAVLKVFQSRARHWKRTRKEAGL